MNKAICFKLINRLLFDSLWFLYFWCVGKIYRRYKHDYKSISTVRLRKDPKSIFKESYFKWYPKWFCVKMCVKMCMIIVITLQLCPSGKENNFSIVIYVGWYFMYISIFGIGFRGKAYIFFDSNNCLILKNCIICSFDRIIRKSCSSDLRAAFPEGPSHNK